MIELSPVDELLPICHQLWDPLVSRLKERNILVIKKSFQCLLTLASNCGDFLRRRTVTDILPHLCRFISNSLSMSHDKTDSSAYRFTLEYDLQLSVLSNIGQLCDYLGIDGQPLWPLIKILLAYLQKSQPPSLQKAAAQSLDIVLRIDPYVTEYMIQVNGPPAARNKIKSLLLQAQKSQKIS